VAERFAELEEVGVGTEKLEAWMIEEGLKLEVGVIEEGEAEAEAPVAGVEATHFVAGGAP
jgi:hypothetical protein